MGRYTGPICRLCRREGIKLCDKHKCASVKRNYPPGMHGKETQGKKSDYAKQLREKQKTKRIFGISEKQLQKYYRKAVASLEESGTELVRQMERRLDNAVFRAGFATTRRQARQLVTHGIFTVNGHRVSVPSFQVKGGDTFTVRPRNKSMYLFENFSQKKLITPSWLKTDQNELSAQVIGTVSSQDIEKSVTPQMIIEFYSR